MLNYDELTTLISRFGASCMRLEASGDYPEKKSDKELLQKLIDLKYTAMMNERLVTGTGTKEI